ncbi:acid ceramidase [Pelomyxa schiedti]|nr:acid ceramidase [Pelomyxa schiedti]
MAVCVGLRTQHIAMLLGTALMSCWCAVAAPPSVPELVVNLDTEAGHRWDHVVDWALAASTWGSGLGAVMADAERSASEAGCWDECRGRLSAAFETRFPDQYAELAGIADYLTAAGHSYSTQDLVTYQYLYELSHTSSGQESLGCTTVLVEDPNGVVRHGHNLDYAVPEYQNASALLSWQKSGEELFSSTQGVLECIGISGNAMCDSCGLTFSYNWRYSIIPLETVLQCIEEDTSIAPLSNYIRARFEQKISFSDLQLELETNPVCSPVYMMLSSTTATQGVALTRDPDSLVFSQSLDVDHWYVVQANYDVWEPPPEGDDRVSMASSFLDSLGQSVGATNYGLWETLSLPGNDTTRGVLSSSTLWTFLMDDNTGNSKSWFR